VDLRTIVAVMFRNWFVVIPAALVTALLGFLAFSHVSPQYETQASVLFLTPNPGASDPAQATNPYNDFSGSLRTTAAALENVILDQQVRAELHAGGLKGTYGVCLSTDAPILDLVIDAPSPESALALQDAVIDQVATQLKLSQDAVQAPTDQRITDQVLDLSSTASKRVVNQNRALIALAVIGLGVTVASAFVAETLLSNRRKGRRRRLHGIAIVPVDAGSDSGPTPLRPTAGAPPATRRAWGRRSTPIGTRPTEVGSQPTPLAGEHEGPDADPTVSDSATEVDWVARGLRRNG
jgi:capsular polysaccharide biosynthesis protein